MDTRKLRWIRKWYQRSTQRPYLAPNHGYNYLLLDKGYDITWGDMGHHLSQFIIQRQYRIARIFLKADLTDLSIRIPLYADEKLVEDLIQAGVKITFIPEIDLNQTTFDLESSSSIVKHCLMSGVKPILKYHYYTLEAFLKLAKIDYQIDAYITFWSAKSCRIAKCRYETMHTSFHEFINHFYEVDDRERREIFSYYADNQMYAHLQVILESGYIPEVDSIYDSIHTRTKLIILENLQAGEETKYQFFLKFLIELDTTYLFYLHPSVEEYWKRLKGEFPDISIKLDPRVRQYITTGQLHTFNYQNHDIHQYLNNYDIQKIKEWTDPIDLNYYYYYHGLDYISVMELIGDRLDEENINKILPQHGVCTHLYAHPIFQEYWSIITCNNEIFLQFLDYKGISLPPHEDYISFTRISQSIHRGEYDNQQLINRLIINMKESY